MIKYSKGDAAQAAECLRRHQEAVQGYGQVVRWVWVLGVVSILAIFLSFAFLDVGRWEWPLYIIVGDAPLLIVVWSYIFMKKGWYF